MRAARDRGGICLNVRPKSPDQYRVVGQPIKRTDRPAKLTDGAAYVQDHRVPGMLHGRVVRPAGVGATLASVDEGSVRGVPGFVKVVRSGNFVGVVCEREEDAIRAAGQLKVTWNEKNSLPKQEELYRQLRSAPGGEDKALATEGDVEAGPRGAAKQLQATYERPFTAHASIGPSASPPR